MKWTPKAWPEGLRASMPLALPIAAVGMSFGLLAGPVLGAIPSIVMSAVVWSGTAQFAALTILTSGGGTALAAGAGLLANTRFLPMGFAIAPSVKGGPLQRLLKGAVLADASFVIGHRGGGHFDISAIAWATPVQYVTWVGGTVAGWRAPRRSVIPAAGASTSCFRSSISVSCCPNCSLCTSRPAGAERVDKPIGGTSAQSSLRLWPQLSPSPLHPLARQGYPWWSRQRPR
jgi:hypothetical protein